MGGWAVPARAVSLLILGARCEHKRGEKQDCQFHVLPHFLGVLTARMAIRIAFERAARNAVSTIVLLLEKCRERAPRRCYAFLLPRSRAIPLMAATRLPTARSVAATSTL